MYPYLFLMMWGASKATAHFRASVSLGAHLFVWISWFIVLALMDNLLISCDVPGRPTR